MRQVPIERFKRIIDEGSLRVLKLYVFIVLIIESVDDSYEFLVNSGPQLLSGGSRIKFLFRFFQNVLKLPDERGELLVVYIEVIFAHGQ